MDNVIFVKYKYEGLILPTARYQQLWVNGIVSSQILVKSVPGPISFLPPVRAHSVMS